MYISGSEADYTVLKRNFPVEVIQSLWAMGYMAMIHKSNYQSTKTHFCHLTYAQVCQLKFSANRLYINCFARTLTLSMDNEMTQSQKLIDWN
jgi:hypothetical protein